MRTPQRSMHSRRGQAAVLGVVSLTVLFAVMGLSVDLGWAYFKRHEAQTAADAAAMAAAVYAAQNGYTCGSGGLTCGTVTVCSNPNTYPPTNALQAGCLYAGANGYLTGGHNGRQSVSMLANNTASVPGVSPKLWLQAKVSETVPNFFGGFGGVSAFQVNTSSIAGITVTVPGTCVYVLDPHTPGAFTASGTTSVVATCGIYVNSDSSSAITVSGSAKISSNRILVNGGVSISNSASLSPTPVTQAGAVTDPLANLPMPTFSGCDYTNWSASGGSVTLNPGVYCGGIAISGQTQATFNPGMYIINGGGLNVTGGSQLTGSSVTFFNTATSGQTVKAFSTSGNSTLLLSAPTSGTYDGMLFLEDRAVPYTANNSINGTSSSNLTGTLYFSGSPLIYSGTSSTGSVTAIIAKTVTFTGTSNLKNDPTGQITGLKTTTANLLQ